MQKIILCDEESFYQCKAQTLREENVGSSRLLPWYLIQNIAPSQLAHRDPHR